MPLQIDKNLYENIIEIWGVGPNTLEVETANGRSFRVSAAHNIKSGATSEYWAHYEESTEIEIGDDTLRIYARAHDMPWANGETIEQCLGSALSWIDERGKVVE